MNSISAINTIWVLLGTVLIFFMQAGFAMMECGFTRAKNTGNILLKNFADFAITSCAFWLLGFGIMYGKGNGFFGTIDLASTGDYSSILPSGIPLSAFLIFQTVICAASATITSGAVAERTRFRAYCIYSLVLSILVFPVAGHWIWGGGWLAKLGFRDFAGGSLVHLVGGVSALAGAGMVGPRIGKYDKNGRSKAIPGHSLSLAALGLFILWFGWFGFTGASTKNMEESAISVAAKIFINVNLSAAFSTCVVMAYTKKRYGVIDISMTLNGALAGLVAITAGCAYFEPITSAITGILAGSILVPCLEFIDSKCRIDDPVGAVTVHGVMGLLGTLLVGIFSIQGGLIYGGGLKLLGTQLLGSLAVIAWVGGIMFLLFYILKKTIGLRVSEKAEIVGLDQAEHGILSAYPDFETSSLFTSGMLSTFAEERPNDDLVPIDAAVPVSGSESTGALTRVEIITRQERFEALKHELTNVGITGMTVAPVFGCGIQRGEQELYRGIETEIQLLPKIRVEVVLAKVPLNDVVNAARKALYTGHIGDGKIFISKVDNAVKIRTGEQGYDAMQGRDE